MMVSQQQSTSDVHCVPWGLRQAREWVRSSGLGLRVRNEAGWQDWASSPGRPDAMPSEPHKLYRAQHQWVSWEDWLAGSHITAGAEASGAAFSRADQPGRRTASEVVDAIEAELVESGLGAPAPFRGCRFLVVDLELLPPPSGGEGIQKHISAASLDAVSATQVVAQLRSRNLRCKVLPIAHLHLKLSSV